MRVIELPELARLAVDGLARGSHGTVRTRGVHQSGIIQALLKAIDPKKYDNPESPIQGAKHAYWAAGFAFEQALERQIGANLMEVLAIERPGEIECDEIKQTPDGIEVDTETVHEFKLTWLSSREGVGTGKGWKWRVQVMGYLYTLGWTKAVLWVLWVNNDYAPPMPRFMAYQLEFTEFEIQENWAMLLANKGEAVEEVHDVQA